MSEFFPLAKVVSLVAGYLFTMTVFLSPHQHFKKMQKFTSNLKS